MAMKTEPTEAMVKTDFGLGGLNSYNQYCGTQRYGSPHQSIAPYSPYNGTYPMGQVTQTSAAVSATANYWDQWSQVSLDFQVSGFHLFLFIATYRALSPPMQFQLWPRLTAHLFE